MWQCVLACAYELFLRLQVLRGVYVRQGRRVSATMQGVGHGAGVYGHNLEGGLGGPPPPNVDGGHHFRKKYGFAIKTATICARNIRPTDACGGAFKFEFIFFGTDTCFFVKNIGTNARFKEFGSKFRLFAFLVGGVV